MTNLETELARCDRENKQLKAICKKEGRLLQSLVEEMLSTALKTRKTA